MAELGLRLHPSADTKGDPPTLCARYCATFGSFTSTRT
jgi:hypothetical protein